MTLPVLRHDSPKLTEHNIHDLGNGMDYPISVFFEYMDYPTIKSIFSNSEQYQDLANDPRLWMTLSNRDFGPEFDLKDPKMVKKAYEIHYLMLQRLIKYGNPYAARSREADPSIVTKIKADKKELEKLYNLDSQRLNDFLFPVYIKAAADQDLSQKAISNVNSCINLAFSHNCSVLEKIANESSCNGIKVPVIQKIVNFYLEKGDLDGAIKAVEKLPQDPNFDISISEILFFIVNVALKRDKEEIAEIYAAKIPDLNFRDAASLLIQQRKKDKITYDSKL